MKNLLNSVAFANAAAAAAPAAAPAKSGAPKAEDRIAPVFTGIRSDIKPPATVKRGAKSELATALEKLDVGASLGIMNKTKKQISSTISKVNSAADNQQPKKNADGTVVMIPGAPIKDAAGNVIGHGAAVAEMEKVKEYVAYDVDAKTDPDKATVRIFRTK